MTQNLVDEAPGAAKQKDGGMNEVSAPASAGMPWARLPSTHFVDNRIYCDQDVFDIEQREIFSRVWKFVCHESEIAKPFDFRTTTVAGIPLLIARGADSVTRALVNACSHRGVKLVEEPAGNARRFECLFHRWTYDTLGKCVNIPREEAYRPVGIDKSQCGLKQVRCEVLRGLVFVNLDDNASPLEQFLDGSLDVFDSVFKEAELEVFHYHEQILHTDWKHWQEAALELYHEFLHVINRKSSMTLPAYYQRAWRTFANGHMTVEPFNVEYEKMPGMASRADFTLPGMRPNEFRLVDIFPDLTILARGSVIRIDTQIPLAPGRTLVQFRGLGVKGEPDDVRRHRIVQHAEFWGPFGRNLPEDALAAERQSETMGKASKFSLMAREEDRLTQDDFSLREYFREWERLTGLNAACLR